MIATGQLVASAMTRKPFDPRPSAPMFAPLARSSIANAFRRLRRNQGVRQFHRLLLLLKERLTISTEQNLQHVEIRKRL